MNGIGFLIGPGDSGIIAVNYLSDRFAVDFVIREKKESRKVFLKRRIRKYGLLRVIGQLLFIALIPRWRALTSASRIREIFSRYGLSRVRKHKSFRWEEVDSVNSEQARVLLKKYSPGVVIVVGTRIIGKKTLDHLPARTLNIHAGITPLYRGVHGGYWSQVANDGHFGSTVHYIDKGIDTGKVIRQFYSRPSKADNFVTYPYLQLGIALEEMPDILERMLNGEITPVPEPDLPSRLRTHPTLTEYMYNLLKKGVK